MGPPLPIASGPRTPTSWLRAEGLGGPAGLAAGSSVGETRLPSLHMRVPRKEGAEEAPSYLPVSHSYLPVSHSASPRAPLPAAPTKKEA